MGLAIPDHVCRKTLGGGEQGEKGGKEKEPEEEECDLLLPVPLLMVPVW